ncbi:hypothetical protein BJX64DRAFT_57237 [Aspergillus heterothallicus]
MIAWSKGGQGSPTCIVVVGQRRWPTRRRAGSIQVGVTRWSTDHITLPDQEPWSQPSPGISSSKATTDIACQLVTLGACSDCFAIPLLLFWPFSLLRGYIRLISACQPGGLHFRLLDASVCLTLPIQFFHLQHLLGSIHADCHSHTRCFFLSFQQRFRLTHRQTSFTSPSQ